MAEHLLFGCDALALVRFTEFSLMSKDGGIFKEDKADGCFLAYLSYFVGLWIFWQRKRITFTGGVQKNPLKLTVYIIAVG